MKATKAPDEKPAPPPVEPTEPVDVVDGIPDRSARPAWWKAAILAAVFVAWVAFLVGCLIAGRPYR